MKTLQMFAYSMELQGRKLDKQALGKSFKEVENRLQKAGGKNIIKK